VQIIIAEDAPNALRNSATPAYNAAPSGPAVGDKLTLPSIMLGALVDGQ
jgi:hypothetical protein